MLLSLKIFATFCYVGPLALIQYFNESFYELLNLANYLKTPSKVQYNSLSFIVSEIFLDYSEIKLSDFLFFVTELFLNNLTFFIIDFIFEDFHFINHFYYFTAFIKAFLYIKVAS